MNFFRTVAITGIVLSALTAPALSQAPTACREGRLADGTCVNPVLAQVMRQSTIIATQPKISNTAPLNLPFEDALYPTSQNRYEYTRFFGNPATRPGGVNPSNPVTMP